MRPQIRPKGWGEQIMMLWRPLGKGRLYSECASKSLIMVLEQEVCGRRWVSGCIFLFSAAFPGGCKGPIPCFTPYTHFHSHGLSRHQLAMVHLARL